MDLRYAHFNFLHLAATLLRGRKWEITAVYAPPMQAKEVVCGGSWTTLVTHRQFQLCSA